MVDTILLGLTLYRIHHLRKLSSQHNPYVILFSVINGYDADNIILGSCLRYNATVYYIMELSALHIQPTLLILPYASFSIFLGVIKLQKQTKVNPFLSKNTGSGYVP